MRFSRLVFVWLLAYSCGSGQAAVVGAPAAWRTVPDIGVPPSPRYYHTVQPINASFTGTASSSDTLNIIVFGGFSASGSLLSDVWLLDNGESTWYQLPVTTPAAPSGRVMCASSSIDSHLFIWGGSTSNGLANDFWSYDVSVGAWTSLAVSGVTPSARFRAMSATVFLSNPPASSPANPQVQLSTPSCSAALSTQPYLAITGGISFFGTVDASLYLINLCTYVGYVIQSSSSWPQARFAGCLARRWSAAAGDSLVLAFGRLGSNGTGTDPLVWTFNFTSQQWISTAPAVGQRLIQSSQNSTQFTASGPAQVSAGLFLTSCSLDISSDTLVVSWGAFAPSSDASPAGILLLTFNEVTQLPQMWTQVVFASELQAADGRSDEVVSRFGHAAALYEAQSSVLYTSIGGWSANLTYRVTNEVLTLNLSAVYPLLTSGSGVAGVGAQWSIINGYTVIPPPRWFHTAVVISGVMFVYGGTSSSGVVSDFWSFNLTSFQWTQLSPAGVVPALRYQHTADSWGSVMVVFGGTASDGLLLNDVWTYHSLQGIDSWTPLTPVGTSQPPGVTGHCSAVIQSTLYVYGGLTSVDMSYDLWAFGLTNNEWTLFPRSISVSSGGLTAPVFGPPALYLAKGLSYQGYFIVALGDTRGSDLHTSVWALNSSLSAAETANDTDWILITSLTGREALAAAVSPNQMYFIAGSQYGVYMTATVDIVTSINATVMTTQTVEWDAGTLLVGHSAVFWEQSVIVFGGQYILGQQPLISMGTSQLLLLDLPSSFVSSYTVPSGASTAIACSYGTQGNTCQSCPAGYHTLSPGEIVLSTIASLSINGCYPCPKGFYQPTSGAASALQCLPCESDTYNNVTGASVCTPCPPNMFCNVGSVEPEATHALTPITPAPFVPETALANEATAITAGLGACVIIFLIVMCVVFRWLALKYLPYLDLLYTAHLQRDHGPQMSKSNALGGFMSVLFLVVAVIYALISVVAVGINNVQETQNLVPNIIVTTPISSTLTANVSLARYAGNCIAPPVTTADNMTTSMMDCDPGITATWSDQTTVSVSNASLQCQWLYGQCVAHMLCLQCSVLAPTASLSIQFGESSGGSLASQITVGMSAFAGSPRGNSSLIAGLLPPTGRIFRGIQPTVFQIGITPSIYNNDITARSATGYHLTNGTITLGSSVSAPLLQYEGGLSVQFLLSRDATTLITTRSYKQSLLVFVSACVGGITGLMAVFGLVMRLIELLLENLWCKKAKTIRTFASHTSGHAVPVNAAMVVERKSADTSAQMMNMLVSMNAKRSTAITKGTLLYKRRDSLGKQNQAPQVPPERHHPNYSQGSSPPPPPPPRRDFPPPPLVSPSLTSPTEPANVVA